MGFNKIREMVNDQRSKDIQAIAWPIIALNASYTTLLFFIAHPQKTATEMLFNYWSSENQRDLLAYENKLERHGTHLFRSRPLVSDYELILRSWNDPAMLTKETKISRIINPTGGIDLTTDRMNIDIEKDKAQISQQIDLKVLENIEINDLHIKNIEIKPLKDLPALLGVSMPN